MRRLTAAESQDPAARAAAYGVQETNNIADCGINHRDVDHSRGVHFTSPDLKKIVRLRLIGFCRDTPFWDLSYCYGELKDGTVVPVQLNRCQFGRNFKAELIAMAREAGVFAKGLGLLDDAVISTLRG